MERMVLQEHQELQELQEPQVLQEAHHLVGMVAVMPQLLKSSPVPQVHLVHQDLQVHLDPWVPLVKQAIQVPLVQ